MQGKSIDIDERSHNKRKKKNINTTMNSSRTTEEKPIKEKKQTKTHTKIQEKPENPEMSVISIEHEVRKVYNSSTPR